MKKLIVSAFGLIAVAFLLINLQFLLGVQQGGSFRFFVNVEATLEEPQLGVQPAATKGIRGKAARGVAPSK